MATVTEFNVSVVEVPPDTGEKLEPPLIKTIHWTLGVGLPDAAALKLALDPAFTLTLDGLVVTTGALGAVVTVKVAALVVADPGELVNTASYW
jgi:hypothetical protein